MTRGRWRQGVKVEAGDAQRARIPALCRNCSRGNPGARIPLSSAQTPFSRQGGRACGIRFSDWMMDRHGSHHPRQADSFFAVRPRPDRRPGAFLFFGSTHDSSSNHPDPAPAQLRPGRSHPRRAGRPARAGQRRPVLPGFSPKNVVLTPQKAGGIGGWDDVFTRIAMNLGAVGAGREPVSWDVPPSA